RSAPRSPGWGSRRAAPSPPTTPTRCSPTPDGDPSTTGPPTRIAAGRPGSSSYRRSEPRRVPSGAFHVLHQAGPIGLRPVADRLPEVDGTGAAGHGEHREPPGASADELALARLDQAPGDALAPPVRDHRQSIETAPPAVPSDDEGPDDALLVDGQQEGVMRVLDQGHDSPRVVGDRRFRIRLRPHREDGVGVRG